MKLLFGILLSLFIFIPSPHAETKFSEAIEDNSFLIEEAYNEDWGMVQHVSEFFYLPTFPKDFFFTFTQEWPVPDVKNQFSYTIPYTIFDGGDQGLGDVLINYRYQALQEEKNIVSFSPRLSLLMPTGSVDKGTGYGTLGLQFNLPFSKRWTNQFVTHFNLGMTLLPKAQQEIAEDTISKKTLLNMNGGFSAIWLAKRRFNVLVEVLANIGSEVVSDRDINYFAQYIINPGVRGSIQIGKVEIVPGLSMPLTWTKTNFEPGVLFYLSIEHPFLSGVGADQK